MPIRPLRIILLINTDRGFERGIMRGITRYAHIQGTWEFYRYSPFYRRPWEGENILVRIKRWRADGIIMRENKLMKEILKLGIPAIVSPYLSLDMDAPVVMANDEQIGIKGAEYFLNTPIENLVAMINAIHKFNGT
ncbi:MAG: hypothetical protein GVY19_08805 [Bacteroidetes bacterium]|jgi:LacI family transcriptional regulator|nr:hypothetical protein [Bacteroidota bacterium]